MRHMTSTATLAIAALLAACTQAPAPGTAAHARHSVSGQLLTATATGVVESIDASADTITLAHDPVAELGWPAMTMDFLATPALAARAKPGERVRFGFHANGARFVITRLEPMR